MTKHHVIVFSRAVVRAAQLLELSQSELADILGISAATASRIADDRRVLKPGSKPWQLAVLFIRMFRSLGAMVASDDVAARVWLRGPNVALAGVPLKLIRGPGGLVRTINYLDAVRTNH